MAQLSTGVTSDCCSLQGQIVLSMHVRVTLNPRRCVCLETPIVVSDVELIVQTMDEYASLPDDLIGSSKRWQEWMELERPEDEPLPGISHPHAPHLQAALHASPYTAQKHRLHALEQLK